MDARIVVRQMTEFRSRQWGVYLNGRLLEGGFFSRAAAEAEASARAAMADTFGPEPMAGVLDY